MSEPGICELCEKPLTESEIEYSVGLDYAVCVACLAHISVQLQNKTEWEVFPIQRASPVPMACAEVAYNTYVQLYGTAQSLQKLGQRGGFGLQEFSCLYMGHEPEKGHEQCIVDANAFARTLEELRKQVRDRDERLVNLTADNIRTRREVEVLKAELVVLKRSLDAALRSAEGGDGGDG